MNHLERKYQHYSWLTDCQGRKLIPMFFNYIFIFIWYRERKLSKATSCCVRTKEEPSVPCSEQVQDGSRPGTRLLGCQYDKEFLFLGSFGTHVALWYPATLRVFSERKKKSSILHLALGKFLTSLLSAIIWSIFIFISSQLQPRKDKPCRSDADSALHIQ